MKKIIILSDYFPPCNLTPAERIYSFAHYLSKTGYYPIIVTRNWDIIINDVKDEHKKTGEKIIHEKKSDYEVYYLPFRPTLKNKLFEKYYGSNLYFLYLIVAFIYGIAENFSSYFTPYSSLYNHCKKLLSEDKDIHLMLVSGSPFHLFKFGYKLKKKFAVNWIADYRDDWNTNEFSSDSLFKNFMKKFSQHNEIKWISNASFFISVTDYYVKKISALNGLSGYTILNGYLNDNYSALRKLPSDFFTITYVGSLYQNQSIEIFINAYKKFIDNRPSIKSKVIFVGLMSQSPLFEKIKTQVKGYEKYFEYTQRVPKKEAIHIQFNSDILLLTSYGNLKGIPGSKLYEYVALQKPVLVCPSDNDIIEETLKETGQGYFANNEQECFELLNHLYDEYGHGFSEAKNINLMAVEKYSRYENTKKLSGLLNKISTPKA